MDYKPRIWHDRSADVVEAFPQYSELYSDVQLQHIWFPNEIKVEKDTQNILVDLPSYEKHGILTTLRLFTNYEVFAGQEWWAGRFLKIVKGPEFTRMGTVFSMAELAIHKPFYQKLNKILGLDNEEFYKDYVSNPKLKARMDFLDSMLEHENDLVALGTFSMVEGGILYSAFAYLKDYQNNGRSDIKTIGSGINYSLADEGLHCTASGTVFRHLTKEALEDGVYSKLYGSKANVEYQINLAAMQIYEHECSIIDMVFEQYPDPSKHVERYRTFVKSRLNECLLGLGMPILFEVKDCEISSWFYKNITSFVMHDFFNSLGSQYTMNWLEEDFDMNLVGEEYEKENDLR